MKQIELYRRIAILMYETRYEVSLYDVCSYLNAEADFCEQKKVRRKKKYVKKATGLSKKILRRFRDAEKGYSERREEYSLAQEYLMISNALYYMDHWYGFAADNPELYQEASDHFDELERRILQECETSMTEEYQDLMTDGTIKEDRWEEAIVRYMGKNRFIVHDDTREENEDD